jgi:hypothetical protein
MAAEYRFVATLRFRVKIAPVDSLKKKQPKLRAVCGS